MVLRCWIDSVLRSVQIIPGSREKGGLQTEQMLQLQGRIDIFMDRIQPVEPRLGKCQLRIGDLEQVLGAVIISEQSVLIAAPGLFYITSLGLNRFPGQKHPVAGIVVLRSEGTFEEIDLLELLLD